MTEAESVFRDKDLSVALLVLEVSRNSFYFWSPKEIGGSGQGVEILNKINTAQRRIPSGWRGVVFADGVGAGAAFIGNAFFMAGGPVGVGAYFASVAYGAAISSAMGSWL